MQKILLPPGFRGCCRLERAGALVQEESAGYADQANQIPNTNDTKFATASAGKVL